MRFTIYGTHVLRFNYLTLRIPFQAAMIDVKVREVTNCVEILISKSFEIRLSKNLLFRLSIVLAKLH